MDNYYNLFYSLDKTRLILFIFILLAKIFSEEFWLKLELI